MVVRSASGLEQPPDSITVSLGTLGEVFKGVFESVAVVSVAPVLVFGEVSEWMTLRLEGKVAGCHAEEVS